MIEELKSWLLLWSDGHNENYPRMAFCQACGEDKFYLTKQEVMGDEYPAIVCAGCDQFAGYADNPYEEVR